MMIPGLTRRPALVSSAASSAERERNFNNPDVSIQSWYVAARSAEVRQGKILPVSMLGRELILYRDATGQPHAMDARCPHLGAHLRHGRVIEGGIQCAFHHWSFGPDGGCRGAPALDQIPRRRIRVYPVEERWGLIWLFNGPTPLFDLPAPPSGSSFRILRPPSQKIGCHPHLVIANGLDTSHFEALHGMELEEPARLLVEPPYRVTVTLRGKPLSPLLRSITGTHRASIQASFTTIGGNLAWAEVESPVRFYILFTARPAPAGCITQVVLFLPPRLGRDLLRAVASIYILLRDDRRVLDDIRFIPGFTQADAPLQAFVDLVNGMKRG